MKANIRRRRGAHSDKSEAVWSVWRQDDNGNIFLVRDSLTEPDARKLVHELEEEGHKQTYWVKENRQGSQE